ncbi:MAG: mannosyl-glycoprotein endo-beta-N-acetylglucosamidase, partial [Clostridia bacterium]|nr:mannosyl-glycoprotein endo-beta-N-acetylglucosamidase [Clostridia bacterium]
KTAAQIIKNGGYATSPTYVQNLCSVIERWNLTQYDIQYDVNYDVNVKADVPFLVKVSITNLNVRKGPGADYARTQSIPTGVYTIVEVKSGKDSTSGWGRLKSGIGWVSLDYCTRL